jgi:hypothetical protein
MHQFNSLALLLALLLSYSSQLVLIYDSFSGLRAMAQVLDA